MKHYDLVVVGGGFAGVAAALAAAEEGCRVLLIEKGNALGGAAVHALVNPFMVNATKIDGVKTQLSAGIFQRITEQLQARNAMRNLFFLEEELKFILNEMLCQANVDILFHTYLCSVCKTDGNIYAITVATQTGLQEIAADYFIDATGNAQLTTLSQCPTVQGREEDGLCQPMTLCFRLGNVDVQRFCEGRPAIDAAYAQAHAAGQLLNPREDILAFTTPIPNVLHFNTTRVVKLNPTDPADVTKAEILARKQVFEIVDFMKQHGAGLEDSFLMMTGAEIGIRESRRIVGEYVLTEADCRNCVKFPDAIAACNYDIDIHNPAGSGTSHYFFPEGAFYTIPYRSLIPKNAKNLLVAGRCISSDHGAQASYRIMPTVCCIGEAAGVAVSLAAKSKTEVRQIDIPLLQKTLKKRNAFIGI